MKLTPGKRSTSFPERVSVAVAEEPLLISTAELLLPGKPPGAAKVTLPVGAGPPLWPCTVAVRVTGVVGVIPLVGETENCTVGTGRDGLSSTWTDTVSLVACQF